MPGARVMIYGYDTTLQRSPDFARLSDFAPSLAPQVAALLQADGCRRLLLVGHSLGGLLLQEALLRIAQSDRPLLDQIAGLLFFGVPNHGLAVPSLVPLLNGHPNKRLVQSLDPRAVALAQQRDEFSRLLEQTQFCVFSFYETKESPTAVRDMITERFKMTGPPVRLVSASSATDCMPPGSEDHVFAVDRPHAELVSFAHRDPYCDSVVQCMGAALARLSVEDDDPDDKGKGRPRPPLVDGTGLSMHAKQLLYESLSFEHMDLRRDNIARAYKDTCGWLTGLDVYLAWLDAGQVDQHHGVLWILGAAGTGKTTLLKTCADAAFMDDDGSIVLSFYFNAHGRGLERSPEGLYRSLLAQLLRRNRQLLHVLDLLGLVTQQVEDHAWTLGPLQRLLEEAVRRCTGSRLVLFIDALDECNEAAIRDTLAFFEETSDMAWTAGVELFVCFTSRPGPDLLATDAGLTLQLAEQPGHARDLATYLQGRLLVEEEEPPRAAQAREALAVRAAGVFLWAVLVVDILNREYVGGRFDLLVGISGMPPSLPELLRKMLARDRRNRTERLLCLQWVLFAQRPLVPRELHFAIQADQEYRLSTSLSQISEESIREQLASLSKSLTQCTTVAAVPTVQLRHEAVRDFLLQGGAQEVWPDLGDASFDGASHERLRRCCVNQLDLAGCLFSRSARTPPVHTSLREDAVCEFPFVDYACRHVLFHADAAEQAGISQAAFLAAFRLADWLQMANIFADPADRHTNQATLLYLLAEQDLPSLITIHAARADWLVVGAERYGPPILAALACRSYRAVRALLAVQGQRHPETSRLHTLWQTYAPETPRRRCPGRTLRFSREHSLFEYLFVYLGEAVVTEYLVADDCFALESRGSRDRTPLSWAAAHGSTEIVRRLLDRGARTEAADAQGRTPLWWVVGSGDTASVRLLLDGGARTEVADETGRTPLARAAAMGAHGMVRLLLGQGVPIDAADAVGRTPLSWAVAAPDSEETVQLLLRAGAQTEAADQKGRTPLSWAAFWGRSACVALLVAGGAQLEAADADGWTPLFWAILAGETETVRVLLDKGAQVYAQDTEGQTPLAVAREQENEEVLKMLERTG